MYWEPAPLYNGCTLQHNDIHEAFFRGAGSWRTECLGEIAVCGGGIASFILFFAMHVNQTCYPKYYFMSLLVCDQCHTGREAGCVLQHSFLSQVERKEEDTREAGV